MLGMHRGSFVFGMGHLGLAILCLFWCRLAAAERFPGSQRVDVLLIGQPHGYGGTQAADCLMLESLSNLRFHTVPVPHDSGDHVADVDGHFGKDPKWVPIRRDAILAALKQPHDAVLVAAASADPEIEKALADFVAAGGTLVWMAGGGLPVGLAVTPAARDSADPLAGMQLADLGMKLAGKPQPLPDGLATVVELPAANAKQKPQPLVGLCTAGKGRVLAIAANNSLFPATFAPGIDGDLVWAAALERLVRFARGEKLPPAAPVADAVAPSLPLAIDLFTTKQGTAPDFATASSLVIEPTSDMGQATLHWRALDWARKTVKHAAEPIALAAGKNVEKSFAFAMADPDPRAFVAWLEAIVVDPSGKPLGRATTKLYRYRPYDMTEQLLLASWHLGDVGRPGLADQFARYLRESGFNAEFSFRDKEVAERHNFRSYDEHQAATRMGIQTAPFSAPVEGYAQRYFEEGRRRGGAAKGFGEPGFRGPWPSAALNLFSMGEETGYGPWSEAYPWRKEPEAPEDCNKWFRFYLQQVYGADLAKLNAAWGKEFKGWQEIKVWRKYAEPFGWLFMPPPKEVESNLTPYVDTHAFHEWHVRQYTENQMRGFVAANPVPTWTMSYDFTFLQFCPAPMTHFWNAVAPEGVALWHAYVRSRTPPPSNPFHLDWMFFEDEPMNNQFLQLGLASGCTYLSTWGHAFNGDLTPSRTSLAVARTMKQAELPDAVLRKMTPRADAEVGIFTFDSRWALVRGRYGFFMDRDGPHDLTMGKAAHQAPGASYLMPPELPLYTALSASGYAPKYVKPDELAGCKVLFVPYVEAIDLETAALLRRYVEGGGSLVVFPTLARYDSGGKPYAKCPGAGLDALMGFTADPAWVMGRSQVEFPGRNAALEAFAESWIIGGEKPEAARAADRQPPLFFDLPVHVGGHPNHYCPEGHQKLADLAKDTVVVGRHQDGEPLFTWRKVGAGEAICFNVLLAGGSTLSVPVDDTTETFRAVIDQLVRRRGITPAFEFRNLRAYDEGISDFVTMQYDLPGTSTRVLALFGDHRGRTAHARLRIRQPFAVVHDLLSGEALPMLRDPAREVLETAIVVEPGHWRLLALGTAPPLQPALVGPAAAALGDIASFTLGSARTETVFGRIEVAGPDGELLAHHTAGVAVKPGEPVALRLRLDDPVGDGAGAARPWKVRFVEAITAAVAEVPLAVRPSAASAALAKAALPAEPEMRSRQLARRGPEVSAAEFIALVERLRSLHFSPGPVDKRLSSGFSYELGGSRQDALRRLACVDWPAHAQALADHVAGGARLYLVGEDLGIDPKSGVSLTPGRRPRIVSALLGLVASKRAALHAVTGEPDLRVLAIGKGLIVLDRRSPDAAGNSNLHLALFQRQWRSRMQRLGLAPDGGQPPLGPALTEEIGEWLLPNRKK
jgi:hypothetical protein